MEISVPIRMLELYIGLCNPKWIRHHEETQPSCGEMSVSISHKLLFLKPWVMSPQRITAYISFNVQTYLALIVAILGTATTSSYNIICLGYQVSALSPTRRLVTYSSTASLPRNI